MQLQPTTLLTPTNLQVHFIFSQSYMLPHEGIKRACKPSHTTLHGFMRTSRSRAMNVHRLEQPACVFQAVVLQPNSSTAHNIRLNEILDRRALFGNQTGVLLTSSGASTNRGASNPFFVTSHFTTRQQPNK